MELAIVPKNWGEGKTESLVPVARVVQVFKGLAKDVGEEWKLRDLWRNSAFKTLEECTTRPH